MQDKGRHRGVGGRAIASDHLQPRRCTRRGHRGTAWWFCVFLGRPPRRDPPARGRRALPRHPPRWPSRRPPRRLLAAEHFDRPHAGSSRLPACVEATAAALGRRHPPQIGPSRGSTTPGGAERTTRSRRARAQRGNPRLHYEAPLGFTRAVVLPLLGKQRRTRSARPRALFSHEMLRSTTFLARRRVFWRLALGSFKKLDIGL